MSIENYTVSRKRYLAILRALGLAWAAAKVEEELTRTPGQGDPRLWLRELIDWAESHQLEEVEGV